jgi:hypothetical protein
MKITHYAILAKIEAVKDLIPKKYIINNVHLKY